MRIIEEIGATSLTNINAEEVAARYNNDILFKAGMDTQIKFLILNVFISFILISDDPRLCYSIREQVCVGVWPSPKGFESKGFATTLLIKSRCIDASKWHIENCK